MILVFDTSAFSAVLSNNVEIIRASTNVESADYALPLAADAELRFGFRLGTRGQRNFVDYEDVKQLYDIRIVAPDQDTSIIYSDLALWCRKSGVAMSNNDLWIAAICKQVGGQLLTLDKDFSRLPQISLVNLSISK